MALDSSNQLAIARSGALQGLAVMVASGDIVQVRCGAAAAHAAAHALQGTAAAGALWNLAAHEENKLPIAQSGVIPSLIRWPPAPWPPAHVVTRARQAALLCQRGLQVERVRRAAEPVRASKQQG
jgi:hypothetical protein